MAIVDMGAPMQKLTFFNLADISLFLLVLVKG